MNIGLRITTNEGEKNLSHSMIQMKETSSLIILLRYLQKYIAEEKKTVGADIHVS